MTERDNPTPKSDQTAATHLSPEDAAHGELGALSDEELPMLAAHWLVDGYDSDLLRTVAGMTNRERHEARRMMPEMLASIGYPLFPTESLWDQAEWRGYWSTIAWAVRQMDRKLTPYAAAQTVLEIVIDVPELWEPADGNHLRSLLHAWDEAPGNRPEIDEQLRQHLRTLHRNDVPPLVPPPHPS